MLKAVGTGFALLSVVIAFSCTSTTPATFGGNHSSGGGGGADQGSGSDGASSGTGAESSGGAPSSSGGMSGGGNPSTSSGGVPNLCGNDELDDGETCDGDCPESCLDQDHCTKDALKGSAEECSAECAFTDIASCKPNDGCCPAGCHPGNDDDCAPQDVLLIGSFNAGGEETAITTALNDSGLFGTVTYLNAWDALPQATDFDGIEVVFAFGNISLFEDDRATLGDLLADYFDGGGRLVVGIPFFMNQFRLGGRLDLENYFALTEGDTLPSAQTLQDVLVPNSPLMAGVTAVTTDLGSDSVAAEGATAMATFDGGGDVAARVVKDGRSRIDLNVYYQTGFFGGDAEQLLINALLYP